MWWHTWTIFSWGTKGMWTMQRFKDALTAKFSIKDIGEVYLHKGCRIHRDTPENILKANQRVYPKTVVDRFSACNVIKLLAFSDPKHKITLRVVRHS